MANLYKIKEIAKQKGIQLNDIALKIGRTPQALSLMMRDGATTTTTIEQIAQVLDVAPAVFFEGYTPARQEPSSDFIEMLKQKDAIIAQKDAIIAQKDKMIELLMAKS